MTVTKVALIHRINPSLYFPFYSSSANAVVPKLFRFPASTVRTLRPPNLCIAQISFLSAYLWSDSKTTKAGFPNRVGIDFLEVDGILKGTDEH